MFKAYPPKQSSAAREFKRKAREHGLAPEDIAIYPSKTVAVTGRGNTVSKTFNAIAIPKRLRYSLKAWGQPFTYQGIVTKRYDVPAMLAMFGVGRATIYAWIKAGYLPEAFIRVSGKTEKVYWLYHQVQPMYVWYHHMKARGIRNPCLIRSYPKEHKQLKALQRISDRRWHKLLGIEYQDKYAYFFGKFGVAPLSD